MRKKSVKHALTVFVFLAFLGVLTKFGIYAVAILAIYVTACIMRSRR